MKYSEHRQHLLESGFSVCQKFLSETLINTLREQRDGDIKGSAQHLMNYSY